jgi:hypothetical protein
MNIPNSTSGSSQQSAAKLDTALAAERLIYVLHEQTQIGPFTPPQAREFLATGEIARADLAWCEGHTDWIPIEQLLANCPPSKPSARAGQPEINSLTAISFKHDKFGNPKVGGWLRMFYILIALALVASAWQMARSIATGECSLDSLALGYKKYKIAPGGPIVWPGQFMYAALDSFPLINEDFTRYGERNVVVGYLRGFVGYLNLLSLLLAALLMPDLWVAPKTRQALRENSSSWFSRWVPSSRQLFIVVGWTCLISGGFDVIEGVRMWMGEVFWSAGPSLILGLSIVLYSRASIRLRETLPLPNAHELASVDDVLVAKGIFSPVSRLIGIATGSWGIAFGGQARSRIMPTSVRAVVIIVVVAVINILAASVLQDGAEDNAVTRFWKPVVSDTIQGATDLGALGAIGGTFVAPGGGTIAGGGAGVIVGGGLGLMWGVGHGLWNVWDGNSKQFFPSNMSKEERFAFPAKPAVQRLPAYQDPTVYKPLEQPER